MRVMVAILLSSMALAFSGSVMPGPLLTYTIKQSLNVGAKAGFLIILGHALLEFALIVLIFFRFNGILQSSVAQAVIGLVGGALLIAMGVNMGWGAYRNTVKVNAQDARGSRSMVLSGVLISAMNPYFLIWWAIIGLGFLMNAYQGYGAAGVAVFYVGHIAIDFFWYGMISTVIGKTRRFINQTLYRVLIGVLGCVLIYFGATFLINALKALGAL